MRVSMRTSLRFEALTSIPSLRLNREFAMDELRRAGERRDCAQGQALAAVRQQLACANFIVGARRRPRGHAGSGFEFPICNRERLAFDCVGQVWNADDEFSAKRGQDAGTEGVVTRLVKPLPLSLRR